MIEVNNSRFHSDPIKHIEQLKTAFEAVNEKTPEILHIGKNEVNFLSRYLKKNSDIYSRHFTTYFFKQIVLDLAIIEDENENKLEVL